MSLSITTTYAGEFAGKYIAAALLSADTLDKGTITIMPNVKFKSVIQKASTDDIVKDASCDFQTGQGTLTLTEKILQPEEFQVNLDLCKKDLHSSWQAAEMGFGLNDTLPASFSDFVLAHVAAKVADRTEKNIWSGSTATSGQFDGFATLLAADGDLPAGQDITGTAVTADTYKIVAIDTTAHTVTLDAPYRGATEVIVNAAAELIPSASGLAAEWGVSLAGLDLIFVNGKIEDTQAVWDVSLDADSFGVTPLVNSVRATPGTGTYKQVAELEWFANGNNGEAFRNEARNNFPFTGNALAAETYDVIEIALERGRKDSLGYVNSPQVISLFIDSGKDTSGHYALAATTDDITDSLEDLLAGVPVYGGAVTANGGALADGDLALT